MCILLLLLSTIFLAGIKFYWRKEYLGVFNNFYSPQKELKFSPNNSKNATLDLFFYPYKYLCSSAFTKYFLDSCINLSSVLLYSNGSFYQSLYLIFKAIHYIFECPKIIFFSHFSFPTFFQTSLLIIAHMQGCFCQSVILVFTDCWIV